MRELHEAADIVDAFAMEIKDGSGRLLVQAAASRLRRRASETATGPKADQVANYGVHLENRVWFSEGLMRQINPKWDGTAEKGTALHEARVLLGMKSPSLPAEGCDSAAAAQSSRTPTHG